MKPTPLTLITGASRGLGRAIAEQRIAAGHRVLTISRHPVALAGEDGDRGNVAGEDGDRGNVAGEERGNVADDGDGGNGDAGDRRVEQWSADLADAPACAARLESWLAAIDPATVQSATLINNAGVVSRLAPLGAVPIDDLSNALRVGLEAPALLASAFLRATAAWGVPRKLLFVSSGLGRRAMAGSASYCAAKAGLDHLARAIALEEADRPGGARVVSLAPGVIDTGMQVQLRDADPALFPDRDRFVGLKTGGQLDSPDEAAAKVLRVLDRADFGVQPVADVRDA